MTLVRYEPWSLLNQFQHDIQRMFDSSNATSTQDNGNVVTSDWTPPVDIKEEDQRFVIRADIPGVDAKDIDVHMENGLLTLRGARAHETREERNGYKRVERAPGTFYRRFTLPDTADADQIHAVCRNGVLEITIPKHQKVQPRKITVQAQG